jgi:hypothetical protein
LASKRNENIKETEARNAKKMNQLFLLELTNISEPQSRFAFFRFDGEKLYISETCSP